MSKHSDTWNILHSDYLHKQETNKNTRGILPAG